MAYRKSENQHKLFQFGFNVVRPDTENVVRRREQTEEQDSEEELENETKNIIQVTKICQQLNRELLQHRFIPFIGERVVTTLLPGTLRECSTFP